MNRVAGLSVLLSLLVFSQLFITSCKREVSPERSLQNFIEYSFSSNQSRDRLATMTAGELKNQILDMNDEEFEVYTDMSRFELRRFRIERSQCSETECFITYIIRYGQFEGEERAFDAEVRKIAELTLDQNTWKISDVKDVKTFYDSKKGIDL